MLANPGQSIAPALARCPPQVSTLFSTYSWEVRTTKNFRTPREQALCGKGLRTRASEPTPRVTSGETLMTRGVDRPCLSQGLARAGVSARGYSYSWHRNLSIDSICHSAQDKTKAGCLPTQPPPPLQNNIGVHTMQAYASVPLLCCHALALYLR